MLTGFPIFSEGGLYFKSSLRDNDNTSYSTDHLLIDYDEYHTSSTSNLDRLQHISNSRYIVKNEIAPLFIIKEMLLRTKFQILKNRKLFPASMDILVKEPINLKKKGARFLQIIGTLATTNQLKLEFNRWFSDSPSLWSGSEFLNKAELIIPDELEKNDYTLRQHYESLILNLFEDLNSFLETNQSVLKTIIEIDNIKKTTSLAIVAIIISVITLVARSHTIAKIITDIFNKLVEWTQQIIQLK